MAAIEACRTPALGGHVEQCGECGEVRIAYNSCRARRCPKFQGLAGAKWLADREAELLPVAYFHVAFTMPAPIAAIALQNKAAIYDILFKAAAETVRIIAADTKHLGAETGMTAVPAPGGKVSFIARMSIASCPVAASRLTVVGSPVDPGSSCPSACCLGSTVICSCNDCRPPSAPVL